MTWDALVYSSLVNSLETKAKKAIEMLRIRMDMDTVTQAMDLLDTETQHFTSVVKNWEGSKKPKVRGQTRLKTRCLGKTKKSSVSRKISFTQLKIDSIFKKPKTRKLCISSDESEELLQKIQALGEQDSKLPEPRDDDVELAGVEPLGDSPLTTDSEVTNGVQVSKKYI